MSVLITGTTFPVKERLREMGGKWDKEAKGWRVQKARANEARGLVADVESKAAASRRAATARKKERAAKKAAKDAEAAD